MILFTPMNVRYKLIQTCISNISREMSSRSIWPVSPGLFLEEFICSLGRRVESDLEVSLVYKRNEFVNSTEISFKSISCNSPPMLQSFANSICTLSSWNS